MSTPANPDDLLAFVRAQLDDDERVARDAMAERPWGFYSDGHGDATFAHIERWAEERVLAEVDAKRQRLTVIELDLADDPTDETAMHLLRLDLLPYADRPGYREEWRP